MAEAKEDESTSEQDIRAQLAAAVAMAIAAMRLIEQEHGHNPMSEMRRCARNTFDNDLLTEFQKEAGKKAVEAVARRIEDGIRATPDGDKA